MQAAKPTFIALAALALLATPAFAKSAKAQKEDAEDSSPPCSSYQLGPDGNWEKLPCQEVGPRSSPQHRAPAKGHEEEPR
ncbi:hypothetical protein [Bradyrhizobium sp.]|uniref:hypothetical protein n=1 Tax=Bradyrhizobium sp. TaxID=376 RepID=UPI0040380B5C